MSCWLLTSSGVLHAVRTLRSLQVPGLTAICQLEPYRQSKDSFYHSGSQFSTISSCEPTHSRHQALWQSRQKCQCRHLATTAQQQTLSLKAALRQLYKKVHPDLFVDFPAEQAENERSFKLLQDYLHQGRNPTPGPASRVAYHFRFFMAPQQHTPGHEVPLDHASAAAADKPMFEMVQLVLVPPAPPRSRPASSSSSGHQALSGSAKQGLVKLLNMCGFADVAAEEEGEEAAPDAAAALSTFLLEAAEVVRQQESGPAKHEVRVANMRAAFRLARGVLVGFPPGAFTGPQQVDALQRLADAFDLLSDDPPDLSGLNILICARTALDSTGALCLDAGDEVEDWAAFLGGVDPEYAWDKKASAAGVRALEGRVAAAVGVRMFFTAAPYLMTHEYRAFLERMAAHAAEVGQVQQHDCSSTGSQLGTGPGPAAQHPRLTTASIPVYVAPTHQHQEQQQAVHESVGYIHVPMQATAHQVYSTIQANAPAALAVLAAKATEQAELAELSSSVRTRLRLRRLLKDELISMQDFRNACNRLLINRDALLQCNIEGLSIRVSDRNRVAPDGSLVDIAWDFDM